MAVTVVKRKLSSMGENGLPININSSLVSGIDLHTGPSSTASHDIVNIYVDNKNTSHAVDFYLHVGGANGTPVQMIFSVPASTYNHPIIEDYIVWGHSASGTRLMGGGESQAAGGQILAYGNYVRYTES